MLIEMLRDNLELVANIDPKSIRLFFNILVQHGRRPHFLALLGVLLTVQDKPVQRNQKLLIRMLGEYLAEVALLFDENVSYRQQLINIHQTSAKVLHAIQNRPHHARCDAAAHRRARCTAERPNPFSRPTCK